METTIDALNDTSTSKALTNVGDQTVYIEVKRDVIIDGLQLNLTGDWYR